ncbi:MAG: helix-turn-helix transcriptional regulator [Novosphingobium sp.]
MSSRETLARNLRLLRAARGISQEALADAASIARSYVSALERSRYSASIDRLDKLAAQLGVETHVLLMKDLPSDALKR